MLLEFEREVESALEKPPAGLVEPFGESQLPASNQREVGEETLVMRKEVSFPEKIMMSAIENQRLLVREILDRKNVLSAHTVQLSHGDIETRKRDVNQHTARQHEVESPIGKGKVVDCAVDHFDVRQRLTGERARVRLGLDTGDRAPVPEDMAQRNEIMASIASDLEGAGDLEVGENRMKGVDARAPVDDVAIGVCVPEFAAPGCQLVFDISTRSVYWCPSPETG